MMNGKLLKQSPCLQPDPGATSLSVKVDCYGTDPNIAEQNHTEAWPDTLTCTAAITGFGRSSMALQQSKASTARFGRLGRSASSPSSLLQVRKRTEDPGLTPKK